MFESGLAGADYPEMAAEGDRAFAILRTACQSLIETMPQSRRPPAMMMALHIWSLSHGIASLFARGDRARRPIPMTPEELLEAATLIYLDGLGVPFASDSGARDLGSSDPGAAGPGGPAKNP
jgi:hypothetical protein